MMIYRTQPSVQAPVVSDAGYLPVIAQTREVTPVPAAWPVGVSQLAIAHEVVCRDRRDAEVRHDWVVSAR